jgi:hypothetical protein
MKKFQNFISFSLCCNHFTSLAYEIFYARKVDLFDKIKEVVFFPTFSVCVVFNSFLALEWDFVLCRIQKKVQKFPTLALSIRNVDFMMVRLK